MLNRGGFVHAARERAGLTCRELAEKAGCSLRYVHDIEQGCSPSIRVLNGLVQALQLSAWEQRFLFAACGRILPDPALTDTDISQRYLDALQPHPAAALHPSWRFKAWNQQWQRLFQGVLLAPSMHQWLYLSTTSRRILRNWDEVSQWCVGWLRYGLAVDVDAVKPMVSALMPVTEFRREWEAQVIPVDPATRLWVVRDGGTELRIDMRFWHASPMPGGLLLGVILDAG